MSTLSTLLRMARRAARLRAAALGALLAIASAGAPGTAFAIDWDDAGNSASKLWDDNGNWNPDGDPDGLAVNIGNLANAAGDDTLIDRAYTISSLTITGGASVTNSTDGGATNDFELIVNGLTTIGGAGSTFFVIGGDPDGLDTQGLTINSGAELNLNSTTVQGTAVVEIESGLLDLNAGGTVIGQGRIDFDETLGARTAVFVNDGTLTASTPTPFFFGTPAEGTLQIVATDPDALFDWDGAGTGVLQANGNQTLDIDIEPGVGAAADAFSGTMNLSTGSTIDIATPWSLDTGTINANTAAFGLIIVGQDPSPGRGATIAGGDWTMSGGTVNVDDAWDTLILQSNLIATGGVFSVAGTLQIDGSATFSVGADLAPVGGSADLVVNGAATINQSPFNWDGFVTTTVNDGASLVIAGAEIDTALDGFDGTLNINGGTVTVVNPWEFESATINLDTSATDSDLSGGVITVAGGAATINVVGSGTGEADINAALVIDAALDVNIDPGATLDLNTSTVNVTGTTWDGGAGSVLRNGTATINAITTYNLPGGTVDLDDGADFLNAQLTVNADSLDESGNGYDGVLTISDSGTLIVNLTGGAPWQLDGTLNYFGDATSGTVVGGTSPAEFDGTSTVNIIGEGAIVSRALLRGTVNLLSAGQDLELFGGDLTPGNTNEISGGTVSGPGVLAIDGGQALRGFGTINAPFRGDLDAQLIAEGGTLTVAAPIQDVGTIGTSGAGAVLNVTNPWNTNVAELVVLNGGAVQGSTITNDGNGFRGAGTIAARVINNTTIVSTTPGVLLVNNAANDWDGSTNTGTLRATQGTLEVADNAPFVFNGTVQADGGTVFVNGFGLELEPASTLVLSSGRYRTNAGSLIGGTVQVVAGLASTIESSATVTFEAGSTTTLNANLALNANATVVQAGATFAGSGDLVNLAGARLNLADSSIVGVQVTNAGGLSIGSAGAGRTDLTDFVQEPSGATSLDVLGLGLGAFDRLVTSGIAQLDGLLNVVSGAPLPLGSTVQAITATGGVLGAFDQVNSLGAALGAGLEWQAVYNANSVQLVVGLVLPGDFNNDGSVDAADYSTWRDAVGTATVLPGDPTPGVVDASDRGVWAANYGATVPAPATAFAFGFSARAAAVPEPSAAVIAAAALAAAACRRR